MAGTLGTGIPLGTGITVGTGATDGSGASDAPGDSEMIGNEAEASGLGQAASLGSAMLGSPPGDAAGLCARAGTTAPINRPPSTTTSMAPAGAGRRFLLM
jgi:hypothetical protein